MGDIWDIYNISIIGWRDKRNKKWVRLISALIIAAFLHQDIVWAQDGVAVWSKAAATSASIKEKSALGADIGIPQNAALTQVTYKGNNGATIINIQDAHSSLGAQESIANIIDSLVTNYDLRVVAIEGSTGYIDTSLLKTFPDEKIRNNAAHNLMAEGRMSAGEFYSVTSGKDIALYGVEEKALYGQNVEEFRKVLELNESLKGDIDALARAFETLKAAVYSEELAAITDNARLQKEGKITFSERLKLDNDLALKLKVDTSAYPNLAKLNRSLRIEKAINFEKANRQRDALIDALSKTLARDDLEKLVLKGLSFKMGKTSQAEFHALLQGLAIKSGISPEPYKDIIAFTEYISLYESIDLVEIVRELESVEGVICGKLFTSDEQRTLCELSGQAELLKGLFGIKLANGDLNRLEETLKACDAKRLASFMREASKKHGIAISGGYDISKIYDAIPQALKFYRTAEERNGLLVSNTVKRMKQEGVNVAALITGGFHTKGISDILKSKNTSCLVILPKFDASRGERPYVAILTKKKAPYEQLIKSGTHYLATGGYFEPDPAVSPEERLLFYKSDIVSLLRSIIGNIKERDKARGIIEAKLAKWSLRYRTRYAKLTEEQKAGKAPADFTAYTPEQVDNFFYKELLPAIFPGSQAQAKPVSVRTLEKRLNGFGKEVGILNKDLLMRRLLEDGLLSKDLGNFDERFAAMCRRTAIDQKIAASIKEEIRKAMQDAGPKPSRDLKGKNPKEDADEIIKALIGENLIVEISLKGFKINVSGKEKPVHQLVAYQIVPMEGYVSGEKDSHDESLGDEIGIDELFTPDQQHYLLEWMESHRLPHNRSVRFRVQLDNAGLGWHDKIEHSNVMHAGNRDGCIYIGQHLLAYLFDPRTEQREELVKLLLEEDELMHLKDDKFDSDKDPKHDERLQRADECMQKIYDFKEFKSHDEALGRYYGFDKEEPNAVRWGVFKPATSDQVVDSNTSATVVVGLYLLGDRAIEDVKQMIMKIWMASKDDQQHWDESDMRLLRVQELSQDGRRLGTSYIFAGSIDKLFEGDYTFKYSLDGGKTWRWANHGMGDNYHISRKAEGPPQRRVPFSVLMRYLVQRNIRSGFLQKRFHRRIRSNIIAKGFRLEKRYLWWRDPQYKKNEGYVKDSKECTFCDPNVEKGEYRTICRGWKFTVNPAPIFYNHLTAFASTHIPQSTSSADLCYDVIGMLDDLQDYNIYWASDSAASVKGHLHVHLFEKESYIRKKRSGQRLGRQLPIEDKKRYPQETIARNAFGEDVVYVVREYPTKDKPITAFMVAGYPNEDRHLIAKRLFDVESIMRKQGFEVDKMFVKEKKSGKIKIYVYPRRKGYADEFCGLKKRLLGPVEMSGVFVIPDEKYFSLGTKKAVDVLNEIGVSASSAFASDFAAMKKAIETQMRPGKDVIRTGERSSKAVKAVVFDLDGVLSQKTLDTLRKAQIDVYAEIMNRPASEVGDEAMEFYTSNDGISSRKLIPEIMKRALSKDKSRRLPRTAEEYYASYSDRRELDFQKLLEAGEGLLSPYGIQLLELITDLPEPPELYLASSRGREDVVEFVKKTGLIRYIGEDRIFSSPEQESSILRGQIKRAAVDEIRKARGLSAEEIVFLDDTINIKNVLGDSAISVIVVNDKDVVQKCKDAKIDYAVTSLEPTAEFLKILLGRDDIEIHLKDRALRAAVRSAVNAYQREEDGIKAQLLSNGYEVTYRQMIENVLRPKLEAAAADEKGKLDIAIIGDAATGKTTTANMIMSADIKRISGIQPSVISTDRFLTDRSERLIDTNTGKPSEDLLSKFTFEEMMERFKAHLRGETIKIPIYDETLRGRMRIGMAENGKPVLFVGDNRLVLEECWEGQKVYFGEARVETKECSNDRIVLAINGTDNVIHLADGKIASVEVNGELQPVKRRKEAQKWPSTRYEVERCGESFERQGDFVEAAQVIGPASRLFITDGMLSLHDKDGYFDDKYDLKLLFACHPDVVFERARRRFVARRSRSAQTAADPSQMRQAEKEFMRLLAVREYTEKDKYIQKDVERESNKDIVTVNTQSVAESIYALYKERKLREHEEVLKRILGPGANAEALEKELDEISRQTKAEAGEDTEKLSVEGRTILVDWTQKEINKKQIAHVEKMVFKARIKKLLALLSDIRMSDNDISLAEQTTPHLYWSRLFLDTMPFYESRLRRVIERAHRDILADPDILNEYRKPSEFLAHISEELHERSLASRKVLMAQERIMWYAYIKTIKELHTEENQSLFSGLIRRLKHLKKGKAMLCVCPMSESIIRAYFKVAVEQGLLPTFIASPRQVDIDGGYTGWNQKAFVKLLNKTAAEMKYEGTVLIERDHGGPRQNTKYEDSSVPDAMERAKRTYRADIDAGFDILDIDCSRVTENEMGQPATPEDIAKYTAEIISHCEHYCKKKDIPPVAYEISYDDKDNPLSEPEKLEAFITSLRKDLDDMGLGDVWSNIVYLVVDTGSRLQGGGQVGRFDADTARQCAVIAEKYGLVLKQHESDYLSNADLRKMAEEGLVGVNIGPEFSRTEYEALKALEDRVNQRIVALGESAGEEQSNLMKTVENRLALNAMWKRWFPGAKTFEQLSPEQKEAACLECGRYVQGEYDVVKARKRLYYMAKKFGIEDDPEKFVTDAIGNRIMRFVDALGCRGIRQDLYDVSLKRSAMLRDIMKMTQAEAMKELTDDGIRSHTDRVARIAVSIAREMGLPAADIDILQRAIWVHDIAQLDKSKYPAALRAINEAMHRLPEDERVEPAEKYLDEWIKHKAAAYNVPAEQIEEAIEKAEKGDRYPIWWLYTLYVALKGRIPAYIFEKDAEKVAAIIYDHGAEAARKLRELNIPVKEDDPVSLLFTYHHDYHQLDVKLEEMTELGEMTREAADRIRSLGVIFVVADGFEQGNNYVRLVEMRKKARVEHFYETINGWLRKREKAEGIKDRRPVEALERLIGKRDKELFAVIAEARSPHVLMPQDEAYIEYLSRNLPKAPGSTTLGAAEPVLMMGAAGGILAWLGNLIGEHPAIATLILCATGLTAIVMIWRRYFPLWWHIWRMYSGNPDERLSSARALGEMKDPRAAKALINELTNDVDEKNLIAARLALLDIGSPVVPALIKALGRDSKYLNRVARTLLEINDPRLSFMTDYLRHTANGESGYSGSLEEGDVAYLLDHLGSGVRRSAQFIPSISRQTQGDRQDHTGSTTLYSFFEPFSILFRLLASRKAAKNETQQPQPQKIEAEKEEPKPIPSAPAAPSVTIGVSGHSSDKFIAAIKGSLGEDARIITAPDSGKFSDVLNSKNMAGVWVDASVTIDMIKGGKLKEAAESALRAKFVTENRPLVLSLNEFSVKDKTRQELINILKLIAANLGKPGKTDIDSDIQSSSPSDNTVFLDKARALVAARKNEIAGVYNELPMPRAYIRNMVIATTERAAEDDPFTFDNIARSLEKGIANVFIYGDRLKTPEEAQKFVRACGYTKDISTICFINKNEFASYQDLVKGIQAAVSKNTGTAVAFDNIGIRAAEGELLKAGEKPDAGRFLEIPLVNINGIEVCAALNTYQILISLVTRLKEPGMALEAVSIPDVSYDKAKGIFKYLPSSLPVDYGTEIETYKNAVKALSSAA